MRFHALVGILPHERDHAQPLEVDLTVTGPDDAAGVLDYRMLYSLTSTAVAAGRIDYLEELAVSIANAAIGLPTVDVVTVAVRKPHVMLDGPLAYAEVAVERRRA
jgi:dihydroneopterin aldolase